MVSCPGPFSPLLLFLPFFSALRSTSTNRHKFLQTPQRRTHGRVGGWTPATHGHQIKKEKRRINKPSCHSLSLSRYNFPFEDFYGFTQVRFLSQTYPSLPCCWASSVSPAFPSLSHLPFLRLSKRAESSFPRRCVHAAPFSSVEPSRGQLQSSGETVEVLPLGTLPVCEWVSGLPGPVITSAAHLSGHAPRLPPSIE